VGHFFFHLVLTFCAQNTCFKFFIAKITVLPTRPESIVTDAVGFVNKMFGTL